MAWSNEFLRIRAIVLALAPFLSTVWTLLLALDVLSKDTKSNFGHLTTSSYLIAVNAITIILLPLLVLASTSNLAEKYHWCFYVLAELAWAVIFALLHLAGAIALTVLKPTFQCSNAENDKFLWCRRLNQAVLVSSWFQASFLISYFVYFMIISILAARHSKSVWCTPVRLVDWDRTVTRPPPPMETDDNKMLPAWLTPSGPASVVDAHMVARDGSSTRYSWALRTSPLVWPLRDSVVSALPNGTV